MDIIGAALPNVMFIVGVLAIGLGLGIELKVVSLNKEIDKTGRIGAFVVGLVLIGASVAMYLNPSIAGRGQAAKADTAAQIGGVAGQPASAAPQILNPTQAPAAIQAAAPTQALAPVAAPTQTPAATQAAAPTQAPVAAPSVAVPDLHGLSDKDVQKRLEDAGLQPRKAERCAGPDQSDPKAKKGRVMCQNPPAGRAIASGAAVEYVLQR